LQQNHIFTAISKPAMSEENRLVERNEKSVVWNI